MMLPPGLISSDYAGEVLKDLPVAYLRLGDPTSYSKQVLADLPAAYYRLGESSGTTAVDSSGNGHNGTYVGGVTLGETGAITSDVDTAALFDGSSGYESTPDGTGLSPTSSISVECWYKTTNASSQYLVTKTEDSFYIGTGITSSGCLEIFLDNVSAAWLVDPTTSNDGLWHHCVVAWDGTTIRLYRDGLQVASVGAVGTLKSGSSPLFIGYRGSGDPTRYFAGTIDEVAIYSTALSAARVLDHYNAGLAKLALDSSGNGHNGSYTGTYTLGQTGAIVMDSNAATAFDGSTSYINLGNVLNPTNDFTIVAWIYRAATGTRHEIVSKEDDSPIGGYALTVLATDVPQFGVFNTTGYPFINGVATISAGAWHHLVGVRDSASGELRIYIDGSLSAAGSAGPTPSSSAQNLLIGAYPNGGSPALFFNGTIDEVAIYPTALSAARVLAHYNKGKGQ